MTAESKTPLVGLAARRALLAAALRAHDTALARNPDDARLQARRAELVGELRGVAPPGDLEQMHERMVVLEGEMARIRTATTADEARLLELVREYEQLSADINEAERWATREVKP